MTITEQLEKAARLRVQSHNLQKQLLETNEALNEIDLVGLENFYIDVQAVALDKVDGSGFIDLVRGNTDKVRLYFTLDAMYSLYNHLATKCD